MKTLDKFLSWYQLYLHSSNAITADMFIILMDKFKDYE